jgi:UDP-glucose 4-epimerase
MKIIVTGGAGFIGSHLVDKLIKNGHKIVVIDNLSSGRRENINKKANFYKVDICSSKISQIFKKEKPGVVFHYAAQIDVRKSAESPIQDAKTNILGSLNILENCKKYRVKKFVFASSGGAIYGEADVVPTPETFQPRPESPYAIAKLTVEHYLDFYKKICDLDYISLRYANVYGPRQDPKGEAGVVAIFINKLLNNKNPIIFGNGKQTRDFVYVEDAADVAIKVLKVKPRENPIFNVGTSTEVSINDLCELISKKIGKNIRPLFASAKSGDLKRSCLDFSKIKKELKWQPEYSLSEGLKEVVEWFKNENRF